MKGIDNVYLICPKCGERVVFECASEEEECRGFSGEGVPYRVAVNLEGEMEECKGCGAWVEFVIVDAPRYYRVSGVTFSEGSSEDINED